MAEGQYRFERLTPTDDVDLSIYENAIDYVFDNTDIRNVAISGAYSAGKSSVLASYKKKHRRSVSCCSNRCISEKMCHYRGENSAGIGSSTY